MKSFISNYTFTSRNIFKKKNLIEYLHISLLLLLVKTCVKTIEILQVQNNKESCNVFDC